MPAMPTSSETQIGLDPATGELVDGGVVAEAAQALDNLCAVLTAAEGQSDNAIAQRLQVNRKTVTLWRARFAQDGLDSLWEVAPGRGRKPTYGPEKIRSICAAPYVDERR